MPATAITEPTVPDTITKEWRESHGKRKFAFRCRSCGQPHEGSHAGENVVPHACRVCGRGVTHGIDFDKAIQQLTAKALSDADRIKLAEQLSNEARAKAGTKTYQPENWDVLADCSDAQLKAWGITKDQVERYVPAKVTIPRGSNVILRAVSDGSKSVENQAGKVS